MRVHVHYVDDSRTFIKSVQRALVTAGDHTFRGEPVVFSFEGFPSGKDYKSAIVSKQTAIPDVILLDLSMHGDDRAGIKLANSVRLLYANAKIIMFTQMNDAETVIACMAAGVDNFLAKQDHFQSVPQAIIDTIRLSAKAEETGVPALAPFSGKTVQDLYGRVPKIIASAVCAVHVQGETGTGKEVVADLFERALGPNVPFIRINCGAIQPNLVESELFGHVKGAFTGAFTDKVGFFEAASGGWLFADEIALLPPHAQRSVLRAIENQEIIRLGDRRRRKINVRILSATNDPLEKGVTDGRFRRDLWQRLSETLIELPPLRERMDELPDLVNFFARTIRGGPYVVPLTTLEVLKRYTWSDGNIRELRNTLRSMTEFEVDRVLWPKAVPVHLYHKMATMPFGMALAKPEPEYEIKLPVSLTQFDYSEVEEDLLAAAIKLFADRDGKVTLSDIQHKLKVPKSTLSRRVRKLIETNRLPEDMFSLRQPISEEESCDKTN